MWRLQGLIQEIKGVNTRRTGDLVSKAVNTAGLIFTTS